MGRHTGRHAGLIALGLCLNGIGFSPIGHAQTVILYENNFEKPNVPLTVDCGNSLDTRGINFLYGTDAFKFTQDFMGPDRVLYAMDYPYQYVPEEVAMLENLDMAPQVRQAFFQDNAQRLFKIPAAAQAV